MSILKLKNRKEILAWSFYDFANQPFSTIIVTFLYGAFFTTVITSDEKTGTFLWTNAIAITAIIASILSPILGAFADTSGYRKFLLLFFTWTCILFSGLLFFPQEGDVYIALIFFVIANISFEMATVFYNSYLPDLATKNNIGRVSGFAWGFGFIGGLLALLLGYALFDIDTSLGIRRMNILVAIWFGVFSIPVFILKDTAKKKLKRTYIYHTFLNLYHTLKEMARYKIILQFLIARLFYNDGLVTIFALGGIYAIGSVGFTFSEVMMLGIVLNICAALGSFLFGFFEDRIGSRLVINITLYVLIFAVILAFISPLITYSKLLFWVSGILIGLMTGPNQSSSRALMARLIPEDKRNEFFGFFAFTGKATAFLGPLFFGIITKLYNQRMALLVVIFFFVIGLYIFNNFKHEKN
ncbi:MAG: MFS transporter [Bacteroidota bacterium]|nr:MFS transporter [Bacteroidota bacterium]